MSIGKALGRVGIVLSVAAMVALVGCTDEGKSTGGGGGGGGGGGDGGGGGGNYNNGEVRIGNQTWTTKNINVNTSGSWCYKDSSSYCSKYGRLYTWEAAKSVCASMGGGWRLPDTADWNKLVNYAGGKDVAGKKLRSKSGWNDRSDGSSGNGTDDYGFSAMPGGNRGSDGSFYSVGDRGYWWSATEGGSDRAYDRGMDIRYDRVEEPTGDKSGGISVRCVTD